MGILSLYSPARFIHQRRHLNHEAKMFSSADRVYNVTLIDKNSGLSTTVKIGSDEYILDSALDQGIELPASCFAGKCVTCACKIQSGEVEQDHTFLKPEELSAGFVLVCKAYPRSDCVLITHQEEELLGEEA
jgi:ferredoxin